MNMLSKVGVLFTIVGAIAALLVVPEFRKIIGLERETIENQTVIRQKPQYPNRSTLPVEQNPRSENLKPCPEEYARLSPGWYKSTVAPAYEPCISTIKQLQEDDDFMSYDPLEESYKLQKQLLGR